MVYYDRQGTSISLGGWARLMEDQDYRRVGWDEVGPYHVSTVWLGIDHAFDGGPPIIFETMIFDTRRMTVSILNDQEYPESVWQDRYCTELSAQAGHDQAVAWCREHVNA